MTPRANARGCLCAWCRSKCCHVCWHMEPWKNTQMTDAVASFHLLMKRGYTGNSSKDFCCCFSCSRIWLFVTPQRVDFCPLWTVLHQAPLSMEFSRQEYWSGLPFPSPGDPPYSGTELASPALAGVLHHWATWKAPHPYKLWLRLNFQGDIQLYPEKVIGF